MSLQLVKAGTTDALTLTGISKRSFDSDICSNLRMKD